LSAGGDYHADGQRNTRQTVTGRTQRPDHDGQQQSTGKTSLSAEPVLQGEQLRDAGEHEENVQSPPRLMAGKDRAEDGLGDDGPYPLTVCSHLKTFWCAPHVHRPDKREQGNAIRAKRIHHRLSWGHKHRIDVVDQHGRSARSLTISGAAGLSWPGV
jgi:hypothetical protein